jgi:hypothetical protein
MFELLMLFCAYVFDKSVIHKYRITFHNAIKKQNGFDNRPDIYHENVSIEQIYKHFNTSKQINELASGGNESLEKAKEILKMYDIHEYNILGGGLMNNW